MASRQPIQGVFVAVCLSGGWFRGAAYVGSSIDPKYDKLPQFRSRVWEAKWAAKRYPNGWNIGRKISKANVLAKATKVDAKLLENYLKTVQNSIRKMTCLRYVSIVDF